MSRISGPRIAVSVADSIGAIGRRRWTKLAEEADAPVFYSYDFLTSLEQRPLSAPSKALYLLGYDGGGDLLAGLPLYFQEARDPFADEPSGPRLQALVGHDWHCYDTTLVSRLPLEPCLVGRFWEALRDLAEQLGADLWGLVNVPLDGPLAAQLTGLGVALETTVPRYRLTMTHEPRCLDEHLSGVSRSSRRTLRQYCRRATRAGAVITCTEGRAGLGQDVLDLCLATADKHAPGYYPPEPLSALVEQLGAQCHILRLELDGALLAASICLLDGSRMHAWAGGCRYPRNLNWSPQYVLFAAELEAGFASGKPVLECGRSNDEFKRRYGLQPHALGRALERRERAR